MGLSLLSQALMDNIMTTTIHFHILYKTQSLLILKVVRSCRKIEKHCSLDTVFIPKQSCKLILFLTLQITSRKNWNLYFYHYMKEALLSIFIFPWFYSNEFHSLYLITSSLKMRFSKRKYVHQSGMRDTR